MDGRLRRPFLTGLVIGIVAAIVVGGLLFFLLFPLVLTHRANWPLEEQIGTNRVLAAIPAADRRAENPLPATPEAIAAGAAQYAGNCLICHGPQGRGDAPIGKNLYPPATDLLSPWVLNMTDGELAWIVRNGLSFVGMPSFRSLMSEEQIWQTILHIRALQEGGKEAPAAQPPAAAAPAAPAPGAAAGGEPSAGQALFTAKGCAGCHGNAAQGGVGPKLAGTTSTFEQVLQVVRNGRGAMPAFASSVVSDAEMRQLYDWFTER